MKAIVVYLTQYKKIKTIPLRTLSICVLLLALTLQSFYRSVMTLDYQIHLPDYLAKCINKDRPELNCNGQCVLMKKIREKEQKEAKKNMVTYEYSSIYIHNEHSVFIANTTSVEEISQPSFPDYTADYLFDYSNAVFRPPINA